MSDFRPTFHWLNLNGVHFDNKSVVPPLISPLVDAVARNADLVPAVDSIVKSLGFDTFMYGLCSGVSFLLPDRDQASVIMCFNSSQPIIDDVRRALINGNLGAMFTFGYYFHELFMRKVVRAGTPSPFEGAPLTLRERECLTHAANGFTTDEIAEKLGIKPRTAQFHFDAIRTKLAAATRQEAVARAVRERLISVGA